jgi:sensor histidine kinase YesM
MNNTIQKKIIGLSSGVVCVMAVIWVFLTYYNQQSIEQYNRSLQRYMQINDVSRLSQQSVTALNNYLVSPSDVNSQTYSTSKAELQRIQAGISGLRNQNNGFLLQNYEGMIGSLLEAMDLTMMFHKQGDLANMASQFTEATKISQYVSETTLEMISKEMTTYDSFYKNIIQQSDSLKALGFWLLALVSFLLILFSYWFSKSIIRPIQTLTIAARELSRGKFDTDIEVNSSDEIAFLARTFDRMRISINNLFQEIQQKAQLERDLQESKLLLRESQLRSLQSQINPHFLFNTLNTLSKKAYMEGAEQTSDLIANVAGLLRYNLRRLDAAVSVSDEVNVLLQYMDIQKARFTGRLKFTREIDESCLSVKLPSLTLQPIIENAVIHAVEPREEGGTIALRIKDRGDHITMEIEDDGAGMDEAKIARIVSEESEAEPQGHSTGIGLSNVIRRLKLFYGETDVIQIASSPEQGTLVTLTLPKERRTEEHV